jgi:hypothetical protein
MEIVADQMGERWREGVLGWMDRDVTDAAKHRVDVAMPAIAWKRTFETMFDHCFDNRGMRTKGVRSTDLNATKSIRRALNVRECHPALSRTGAIGMIGELVPAWRLEVPEASTFYAPYPRLGLPFVILAPESRQVRNQKVTLWVEAPRAPERPLLSEASHWPFA